MCASGDNGMLPADLHRAERYWRWSFGDKPCNVLGRMWCEADDAGELGVLEAGELLWDEAPACQGDAALSEQRHQWPLISQCLSPPTPRRCKTYLGRRSQAWSGNCVWESALAAHVWANPEDCRWTTVSGSATTESG